MTKAISVSISSLVFLGLSLFGAFAVATLPARAQTVAQPACVPVDANLFRGVSFYTYGHYVASLQRFLNQYGYLDSSYASASGYFGPMTYAAVVRFQAAEGLPTTGYVGPLTRARISAHGWCGGGTVQRITIDTAYPTSGPTGTLVSLTGFGFTNSNTVLIDGMVAARNVPVASSIAVACTTNPSCRGGIRQTLTFTVPEYLSPNCPSGSMCPLYVRQLQPGRYPLTITNSNGASNTVYFTVTSGGGSSSGPLSIENLTAPNTLPVGNSGTWSIRVSAPSNSGTLSYSVLWGDEGGYAASAIRAPDTTTSSTFLTFTHTYFTTGTYRPTFTVTDSYGHTVSASATVTVTPIYYY